METPHLHERLEELHKELQQIEFVDESERKALQQLMDDIRKLQEKSEGDPLQEFSLLGGQLRDRVAQLEASHPQATMLMGQVIDTLAKMGI